MAKKRDNTHSEILERMKPFPPSPVPSIYLPIPSSRKLMLIIFAGIGGLILVVLISVLVLWQMGYSIDMSRFTSLFENSDTPMEPTQSSETELPKVEKTRTTEQVTE